MESSKIIYLAIPYTWDAEKSFKIANRVTAQLMLEGYVVFRVINKWIIFKPYLNYITIFESNK